MNGVSVQKIVNLCSFRDTQENFYGQHGLNLCSLNQLFHIKRNIYFPLKLNQRAPHVPAGTCETFEPPSFETFNSSQLINCWYF